MIEHGKEPEMEADILQTIDPRDLGRRLQEARKARGFTQADVAGRLAMARTTVTAIEKGERRVQPAELIQFATLFGRSVNDLLRRSTPAESFVVQFRSLTTEDGTVEATVDPIVWEFQRLCADYRELESVCKAPLPRKYPPEYDFEGATPEQVAEDIAGAERNRLGLGDAPILNLREMLETTVGLRVFSLAMPSRVGAMFAFTEELGGCIAVNRNHPPERRRTSEAHEYGHFLTRRFQSEVLMERRYERVPAHERFANAFARSFLMPLPGLTRLFHERKRSRKGNFSVADLCTLAHHYFVSVEAMARRLEELQLLSSGTWDTLVLAGMRVREAQKALGLPAQEEDDQLLPARYTYLALEAFLVLEELTEKQFADFLRVDRLESRKIAQDFGDLLDVSLSELSRETPTGGRV